MVVRTEVLLSPVVTVGLSDLMDLEPFGVGSVKLLARSIAIGHVSDQRTVLVRPLEEEDLSKNLINLVTQRSVRSSCHLRSI